MRGAGQFGCSGRHVVEPVGALAIGDDFEHVAPARRAEVHADARQHAAGFVRYGSSDGAAALRPGGRGPQQQKDSQDGPYEDAHPKILDRRTLQLS